MILNCNIMTTQTVTDTYKSIVLETFRAGRQATYQKDEIIIQAGDTPKNVQYLVEGFVLVYSLNARGENFTHTVYGPGDIFPVAWIINHYKHNIFYKAMTACTCLVVTMDSLLETLSTDSQASMAFLAETIDHFIVYSDRVDNLIYKYARERLAFRLMYLASRFGEKDGTSYVLPAQLNQQVIGSSINLSRETVGRELERLMSKHAVSYRGKSITIDNVQALADEIKDTANTNWWGLDAV